MYVRITFSNDYSGCDEVEYLEVKSMNDAIIYAEERLPDYAEQYEYLGHFESEEEIETYYEDCSFDIMEIEEEEFFENDGTEL